MIVFSSLNIKFTVKLFINAKLQISCFLAFLQKNAAHSKRWSKYTTGTTYIVAPGQYCAPNFANLN